VELKRRPVADFLNSRSVTAMARAESPEAVEDSRIDITTCLLCWLRSVASAERLGLRFLGTTLLTETVKRA
jgi:hypothetical protein